MIGKNIKNLEKYINEMVEEYAKLVSKKYNIEKEEFKKVWNNDENNDENNDDFFILTKEDLNNDLKICTSCNRYQPTNQFISVINLKICNTCSNCRFLHKKSREKIGSKTQVLKAHYLKLKENLPPCRICGDNITFHKEFNHIDPKGLLDPKNKKLGCISDFRSIKKMNIEAAKCECLCRKCHRKYTQEQHDKNKKIKTKYGKHKKYVNDLKIKIGKCQENNCTDIFDPENLSFYEFDHIDPSTKRQKICTMIGSYSIETLNEELKKCRLICGYCHYLHTLKQITLNSEKFVINNTIKFKDKKNYKKEFINEIKEEYIESNMTQKDIAIKYNIPIGSARGLLTKKYIDPAYKQKLNYKKAQQIRKIYKDNPNLTYKNIGEHIGVGIDSISDVINNISFTINPENLNSDDDSSELSEFEDIIIEDPSENHGNLNYTKAQQIRRIYKKSSKLTYLKLGEYYGISGESVSEIIKNKKWKIKKEDEGKDESSYEEEDNIILEKLLSSKHNGKLDWTKATEIRKTYKDNPNLTYKQISEKYGVTAESIMKVIKNKTYKIKETEE